MGDKQNKTDIELKSDVLAQLKYEPSVKVTQIGVLVKDGTVTLNGEVPSYFEKWDAVRSAERVAGVRAIADEIKVNVPDNLRHTDEDIATAAAKQIGWSAVIPDDSIKAVVRDSWITLEGEVEHWHQKIAAENLVHYLAGVKGVTNLIKLKSGPTSSGIESDIKSAYARSALLDANEIQAKISGSKVTLRGKVRNHAEREEAARVAWAAPGVHAVENLLTVNWPWLGE
jgi:osmotically-inducible protein OsmY